MVPVGTSRGRRRATPARRLDRSRGLATNEIRAWARRPLELALSLALPLLLLLVSVLLLSPRDRELPIGLVTSGEGGEHTESFGRALETRSGVPMYLRIVTTDRSEAERLFRQQRITAIVSLPADFDRRLEQGTAATVDVRTNNAMADVHKNVRYSIWRSLQSFYERDPERQLAVRPVVHHPEAGHTSRAGFLAGGIVVYTTMLAALLWTGVAVAREWEQRTVDLLRTSGVSGTTVALTKVTVGTIQAAAAALAIAAIVAPLTGLEVRGNPLGAVAALVLTAFAFAGIGAIAGAAARRFYLIIPISGITAILCWILGGGFQYLGVTETSLYNEVVTWLPPTYAFDAVQVAISGVGSGRVGTDLLVLSGTALVTTLLAVRTLRSKIEH